MSVSEGVTIAVALKDACGILQQGMVGGNGDNVNEKMVTLQLSLHRPNVIAETPTIKVRIAQIASSNQSVQAIR